MLTPAPGQTLADAVADTARGMDSAEPIIFIRHIGNDDAYLRGGCLIIVPGIWTSMPPPLLAAMRARRACSTTGRCPNCGACLALATGTLAHRPACPVLDKHLRPLLRAWARRVGSRTPGLRIREIPGATS